MSNICDICGKSDNCEVVCSCFGAFSYSICNDCLILGKEPYGVMVQSIAYAGRFPSSISEEYQALVREQLKLHNKTEKEFIKDVDDCIRKMYTFFN